MGRIKLTFLLATLVSVASPGVAHSAPDLLARYHFIGASSLATNTNAAKLTGIFSLPASVEFKDEILRKLARVPGELLPGGPKADSSVLLRPLLDDLLKAESLGEVRRGTNEGEFFFAVQLGEERARVWDSTLSGALAGWAGKKTKPVEWETFRGWEVKMEGESPRVFRFIQANEWVVFGMGGKELSLQNNVLRMIKKDGRPPGLKGTNWLEAEIDWPKIGQWISLAKSPLKLARTEIEISSKADNLRTWVRATYPAKLDWKSEPWRFPNELVRDPLISFTAAQNLAAILNEPADLRNLSVRPLTSQFFMWAQSVSLFHGFMATPVKDAPGALKKLSKELPATFNERLREQNKGEIYWNEEREQVGWKGLSLLAPQIAATNGFLFAGLFPPLPLTNQPPSELVSHVTTKTNLVYYDWEITQERLVHWQLLGQILPPFAPDLDKNQGDTNAVPAPIRKRFLDQKWQAGVAKELGNTATEILQTGPNELTLVRKSHLGLTGFEIMMLTRWLNDPDFPFLGPPPRSAPARK